MLFIEVKQVERIDASNLGLTRSTPTSLLIGQLLSALLPVARIQFLNGPRRDRSLQFYASQ